ncbi:ribonuclease H [Trifolium pratense]|uniref:Ribonuclease H n=1 Tax=Trifolium pratense TaxID=57577 RepID=A0A2K3M7U5_TRIPR|nr:ribonuclease H [Trifolium pratense]
MNFDSPLLQNQNQNLLCFPQNSFSNFSRKIEDFVNFFNDDINFNNDSQSQTKESLISKQFNISIHPPKAPDIKEVIWRPPYVTLVKCNSDGASTLTSLACGGIFRNHNAELLCCFAENTGLNTTYFAELCGAMKAVEIAADNN